MTPPVAVRIRGIYATALTRLALDAGCVVVDPSPPARQRFALGETGEADVSIGDRDDRQGIELTGRETPLRGMLALLRERLPDCIVRGVEGPDDGCERPRAQVEFPGGSKAALDVLRSAAVPTLAGHHRFRIVSPKRLEKAEARLGRHPEKAGEMESRLFDELIFGPLRASGLAGIEHVRISGRTLRLREGFLTDADPGRRRLTIQRVFARGRYDALDLPIEEGDYALTECREGAWHVRHSYYSRDGRPKGFYLNVNTPVELYPCGCRYVDLEVDVACRAGGTPALVDREKLDAAADSGRITERLRRRALEEAEKLLDSSGGAGVD